ncbi:hexosyltransferase [Trichonephila clavipes]|nr:hexosyltransferase [Trichonephila clavipes]
MHRNEEKDKYWLMGPERELKIGKYRWGLLEVLTIHSLENNKLHRKDYSDIKDRTEEKNLWCLVWEGMPVIRTNHSKWYITKEKYSDSAYPNYCSGSAYIINSVVLDAILEQSNHTVPLVPAEDVHVTGVLARQAGVGHVQISSRYAFKSTNEDKIADGQTIFAHLGPGAEDRVEQLWTYLVWKRKQVKNELVDGL